MGDDRLDSVRTALKAIESELAQTRGELAEVQEKFTSFIDNSIDCIMRFDRQYRHLYVNAIVKKLTGIPPDKFIGKTHQELDFPAELVARWEAALDVVFRSGKEHRIDFELPSGTWIDWLLVPEQSEDGQVNTVLTYARDITEYKHVEAQLQKERYLLEAIMNNVPDHIYFKDPEGRFTRANRAQAAWLGEDNPENLIGKTDFDYFSLDHSEPAQHDEQQVIRSGKALRGKEEKETWEDGRVTWVHTTKVPYRDLDGNIIGTFGISRDITERKRTVLALQQSEQRYRLLADHASDLIWTMDMDLNLTYLSPSVTAMRGYTVQEAMTQSLDETLTAESLQKVQKAFGNIMDLEKNGKVEKGRTITLELQYTCKNGSTILAEATMSFLRDPAGSAVGILGVARDITLRKVAEEELRKSEEKYRSLVETLRREYFFYSHDLLGNFTYVSPSITDILGYSQEDFLTHFTHYLTDDPVNLEVSKYTELSMKGIQQPSYEVDIWHKIEGTRRLEVSEHPVYDSQGNITGVEGIARDITEHKKAQMALALSEQRYRVLVESINDIIYKTDIEGHFIYASPAAVRIIGYPQEELVGKHFTELIRHDQRRLVEHYYIRQFRERTLTSYKEFPIITKDDREIWIGQNVQLVYEGDQITGFQAVARDVTERRQAELALQLAHDELELRVRERTVELTESNVKLRSEITERKSAESNLKESLEKYRKAMEGVIRAMALTVEMRDPYTAGHQQRVTDLAHAIALEMGLSQDQIDGICMAGIIHDLGKISIPVEILSKPGRLTSIVFEMIKIHPHVGYEILKGIDFPWPVADIVLQHHERMDGSGYPEGITGKDILLEARILMVADVVEAVSSHRPYRPAKGIDSALQEIFANRGKLYDLKVVDACERVIRKEGFKFKVEQVDIGVTKTDS